MSEVNSKNFPGATVVVVVGSAGGPPQVRSFEKGSSQSELSIAVSKGYKNKTTGDWVDTGTDWYTLIATEDYANQNWPDVGKGDKVRVEDARLEFKPYLRKTGEAGVEATLRFGTLVVVESKESRGASNSRSAGSYADNTPF